MIAKQIKIKCFDQKTQEAMGTSETTTAFGAPFANIVQKMLIT